MGVFELLGQVEDILEEGKATLVGGKTKVDAEAIREVLQEIRLQMPDEILQARKIASERKEILLTAQNTAEEKILEAEEEARKLVDAHEITKEAKSVAADIVTEAKNQAADILSKAKADATDISESAQKWSDDMRSSASNFVDTIMRESDEILSESMDRFAKGADDIRRARQQLKNIPQNN